MKKSILSALLRRPQDTPTLSRRTPHLSKLTLEEKLSLRNFQEKTLILDGAHVIRTLLVFFCLLSISTLNY